MAILASIIAISMASMAISICHYGHKVLPVWPLSLPLVFAIMAIIIAHYGPCHCQYGHYSSLSLATHGHYSCHFGPILLPCAWPLWPLAFAILAISICHLWPLVIAGSICHLWPLSLPCVAIMIAIIWLVVLPLLLPFMAIIIAILALIVAILAISIPLLLP